MTNQDNMISLRPLPLALLCSALAALAAPGAALAGQSRTAGPAPAAPTVAAVPALAPGEPAPTRHSVEVCQDRTRHACTRVQLPLAVGRVQSVLPINTIRNAQLGILVRGVARTSLCYVGTNWKGQPESVCKPVPHARALDRHVITASSMDNVRVFRFTRAPGTKPGKYELTHARNFLIGLVSTERQLQKVANHRLAISTAPGAAAAANSLRTGAATRASVAAEGGACGWDDEGGGYCADGIGGGGIGGGGGGGIGGGGIGGGGAESPYTEQIPVNEIPRPDYDPGYPGTADEAPPADNAPPLELPEVVPDGELGDTSGGSSGVTTTCIMTVDGPVCTVTTPRPFPAPPPVVGGIPGPHTDPDTGAGLPAPAEPTLCERDPRFCEPKFTENESGAGADGRDWTPVERRKYMCWLRLRMDAGWCKAERALYQDNDPYFYVSCLKQALEKKLACDTAAEKGGQHD